MLNQLKNFLSELAPIHKPYWDSCTQETQLLQFAVEHLNQQQLTQLEQYILILHYSGTLANQAEIGAFDKNLPLPKIRQKSFK